MKVLYIPLSSSSKKTDGLYIAMKKKHEVVWYWDFENDQHFDVCYMQSGSITPEALKRLNIGVVTQWTGDYRPKPLDMVNQYKGIVDITFLAAYVPEQYPDLDVRWLPHGVDDWQFREVNPNPDKYMIMVARDYPQFPGGLERRELIKLFGKDLTVYGFNENLDWYKAPDVYNQFRFAIGPNIYNNVNRYFSNRPLNAMAAGCCYFMRWVPGIDNYFEDMVDCFMYRTHQELLELIAVYVSHSNSKSVARSGQAKVHKLFHYDNIVRMWEKELSTNTSEKLKGKYNIKTVDLNTGQEQVKKITFNEYNPRHEG